MPHTIEWGTPSIGTLEESTSSYWCPSQAAGSPASTGWAEGEPPVSPPRGHDCTGGPRGLPEGAIPFSRKPSLQTQVEAIISGTMVERPLVGAKMTCEAPAFFDEIFQVEVWGQTAEKKPCLLNCLHCPNSCPCYSLSTKPFPWSGTGGNRGGNWAFTGALLSSAAAGHPRLYTTYYPGRRGAVCCQTTGPAVRGAAGAAPVFVYSGLSEQRGCSGKVPHYDGTDPVSLSSVGPASCGHRVCLGTGWCGLIAARPARPSIQLRAHVILYLSDLYIPLWHICTVWFSV